MLLASSFIPGFRHNWRIGRSLRWSVCSLCRLAAALTKQIDPCCYQDKNCGGSRNAAPARAPELSYRRLTGPLWGCRKAGTNRLQRFRMCQTLRTTQQMNLEIVLQGRVKPAVQVLFHQFALGNA